MVDSPIVRWTLIWPTTRWTTSASASVNILHRCVFLQSMVRWLIRQKDGLVCATDMSVTHLRFIAVIFHSLFIVITILLCCPADCSTIQNGITGCPFPILYHWHQHLTPRSTFCFAQSIRIPLGEFNLHCHGFSNWSFHPCRTKTPDSHPSTTTQSNSPGESNWTPLSSHTHHTLAYKIGVVHVQGITPERVGWRTPSVVTTCHPQHLAHLSSDPPVRDVCHPLPLKNKKAYLGIN